MREVFVIEARECAVDVSAPEAAALNELGREFASRKRFWRDSDDEGQGRSIVRCIFDGNAWIMRVHNAIGMIRVNDLQVIVTPKIPMSHFIYLLSFSGEIPRFVKDDVAAASSRTLLELIAYWFMSSVDSVLKRDLIRDYVETTDSIAAVRGQLDTLATGTDYYAGRLSLSCRFDDFELDTPLNRILKAGVTVVAGDPHFAAELRRSGSRASQRLDGVGALRHGDFAARSDRRSAHYDDALTLARLLIERQARTVEVGGCSAWGFLIPTPDAVERGIKAILQEGLGQECVVTSESRTLRPSSLTVNPDVVFGLGRAVADVKYKINWDEFPRPDVYQVVAFAAAYDSPRASLISFQTVRPKVISDVPFGLTVVRNLIWDATPAVAPSEAGERLVSATRSWLGLGPSTDSLEQSADIASDRMSVA